MHHQRFNDFSRDFPDHFRAGRGMMEPAILQILLQKPMHGYEIISTIEEQTHGMWRPSAGSIYPTLQLLEEKDWLTSQIEDGKKVYHLTETGHQAAEEAKGRLENNFNDRLHSYGRAQAGQDWRREFGQTMKPMRDILRNGSPEQRDQLIQALRDFKNTIENITRSKK